MARAHNTSSSNFFDETSIIFSHSETDDDNVEFLPLIFVDRVDEGIAPVSTFDLCVKVFHLREEHLFAYFERPYQTCRLLPDPGQTHAETLFIC